MLGGLHRIVNLLTRNPYNQHDIVYFLLWKTSYQMVTVKGTGSTYTKSQVAFPPQHTLIYHNVSGWGISKTEDVGKLIHYRPDLE